jgi:uncharacterized protein with beta-barrel porin domain
LRLAWAHDSDTARAITAAFQMPPGAAFTVNGAEPDADSALVSAGAELRLRSGVSLAARFEGRVLRHHPKLRRHGPAALHVVKMRSSISL